MVRSLLSFNVADLFCGAGGFSTGLLQALGEDRVNLVALNHWERAIETHNANHKGGEKADLYDEDPLKWFKKGELDLLVASPTCTFFSRARGGRPISWDQRRGRMTPVQVVRWCKLLRPRRLLVENVPEFKDWGPVSRATGKPRADKKGIYFRQWIRDLEELGYKVSHRVICAADFGAATTRTRFFLMGRADGAEPRWPRATHSKDGVANMFGEGAEKHRAAREIIKWERRGKSIFTRKKPLAAKTLLRIHAGLIKFGWPVRFVLKLRLYMASLGMSLPEIEWTGNAAQPFVFQMNQSRKRVRGLRGVNEPLGTVTASGTDLGLVEPGVIVLRKHADVQSVDKPLGAVTAGGMHFGLVEPIVMRSDCQGGNGDNVRPASEPTYTPTTNGGLAVVEPFLLSQHFGAPPRSADVPAPPPVAVDRTALVAPFVFANRTHNVPKGVDKPLPTNTTTTGGGIGLVEGQENDRGFVLSQGAGGEPRTVEQPVPAIPTRGAHSLVIPITHADSSNRARSADDPLPSPTSARELAVVAPYYGAGGCKSVEQPLDTITTKDRFGFFVAAFGEREGQDPRVHSLEDPAPALCARGRIPFVHGITLEGLSEVDILFRMLEPDELAAAMSFPEGYQFKGNKTEQTRQIGNAVDVRTARALVAALMEVGP